MIFTRPGDWGPHPRSPAAQRLRRVVLELRARWSRGDFEGCVRNLPLLAELLRGVGLDFEARAAELDWQIVDACPEYGTADLWIHACWPGSSVSFKDVSRSYFNTRRIFWFAPRTLDVVGDHVETLHLWHRYRIFTPQMARCIRPDTELDPQYGLLGPLKEIHRWPRRTNGDPCPAVPAAGD